MRVVWLGVGKASSADVQAESMARENVSDGCVIIRGKGSNFPGFRASWVLYHVSETRQSCQRRSLCSS